MQNVESNVYSINNEPRLRFAAKKRQPPPASALPLADFLRSKRPPGAVPFKGGPFVVKNIGRKYLQAREGCRRAAVNPGSPGAAAAAVARGRAPVAATAVAAANTRAAENARRSNACRSETREPRRRGRRGVVGEPMASVVSGPHAHGWRRLEPERRSAQEPPPGRTEARDAAAATAAPARRSSGPGRRHGRERARLGLDRGHGVRIATERGSDAEATAFPRRGQRLRPPRELEAVGGGARPPQGARGPRPLMWNKATGRRNPAYKLRPRPPSRVANRIAWIVVSLDLRGYRRQQARVLARFVGLVGHVEASSRAAASS